MAERYWEHRTGRQHSYIDVATGRVIGTLFFRLADMLYEAHAYERMLGDYLNPDLAYAAVEQACVSIEEERHKAVLAQLTARAAQADGAAK
jgi:hypothetical protein